MKNNLKPWALAWLQIYMQEPIVRKSIGEGLILAPPSSISNMHDLAIHLDLERFMGLAQEEV